MIMLQYVNRFSDFMHYLISIETLVHSYYVGDFPIFTDGIIKSTCVRVSEILWKIQKH